MGHYCLITGVLILLLILIVHGLCEDLDDVKHTVKAQLMPIDCNVINPWVDVTELTDYTCGLLF